VQFLVVPFKFNFCSSVMLVLLLLQCDACAASATVVLFVVDS
jgi:hypothetical protein